jgi:hypothetical protein
MSNEETKKAADDLIHHFKDYIDKAYSDDIEYDGAVIEDEFIIHVTIASTENTIKELREISNKMYEDSGYTPIYVNPFINQQTELLNELKTRLCK